jgi:hypothetical protein
MIQEVAMNSTASSMVGLSAVSSAFPIIFIVIVVAILVSLAFSIFLSKKLIAFLEKAGVVIGYTFRGVIVSVAGACIYFAATLVSDNAGSVPIEYCLYGIAGFIGLTVLGYISTKIFEMIARNWKKAKAVKK